MYNGKRKEKINRKKRKSVEYIPSWMARRLMVQLSQLWNKFASGKSKEKKQCNFFLQKNSTMKNNIYESMKKNHTFMCTYWRQGLLDILGVFGVMI